MKRIDSLKNRFDQAELLIKEVEELKINIENWDLEKISREKLSRSSLRVIKDGKKGANTTLGNSEKVMEKLVTGAEESAVYGDEAEFDFSSERFNDQNSSGQNNFNNVDEEEIIHFIEECQEYIRQRAKNITLDLNLNKKMEKISVMTTNGGNLREEIVSFNFLFGAPVPGGGSSIYRNLEQPDFFSKVPEDLIDDFLKEYEMTYEVSVPQTGKMPVLFSPRSLYFLFISLEEGISARNLYRRTSPLLDRIDEKIFSEKLTITDLPHMKQSGSRRGFDDEGIPTRKQEIIKTGILKNYIFDLEHAVRMGVQPGGNGLKKELFSGDINTPVSPNLVNPVIEPGDKNKGELISAVDEGILVDGIIGFHSSNYPQGHFSVQAHGFHIKGGKLQGRLQDIMISGNIYEDFMNIVEIGDTIYPAMKGYAPYILVDEISVTGK